MGKQPNVRAVNGFCVACGSRNVVQHAAKRVATHEGGHLVQCRSCGVVSPDFNQRRQREGVRPGVEPLNRAAALAMADQVLDAFASPAVRQRLQDALDAAQGDVAVICHAYLPMAIDVFARIVANFGFAAGLEGVVASVETLQKLARDDLEMVERLVAIRQVLTPTGSWIREDQEAERLEQRRLEQQHAEQQRREQDERLAAEMAARNAALAHLCAKKLALGLDPSVPRLPVLEQVPAPLIAAREGDRVRLRVNVRFSRRCRWFFNGKPIDDTEDPNPLRRGARACTLLLLRMSKRVAGEYYCVCENEEGSAVTPVTRVEMVAKLRADRLADRKLPLIAQQYAGTTVMKIDGDDAREVIAVCTASESSAGVGGGSFGVALLDPETLAPVKLTPSIRAVGNRVAIAWSDQARALAVATDATSSAAAVGRSTGGRNSKSKAVKPGGAVQIALYSIDRAVAAASGQAPRAANARAPSFRGAQSPARSTAIATGNSSSISTPGNTMAITKLLTTQTLALASGFGGGVRAVAFLDGGKLLALTDLDRSVAIYAVSLSQSQPFQLLHAIRSADGDRVSNVAATADAPLLALTFRNAPHIDVVRLAHPSTPNTEKSRDPRSVEPAPITRTRRHQFALAVHRVAIDRAGMFAAVAESASCLKSWISVVNLNTRDTNATTIETPLRSTRRFGAHVGTVTGLQWTNTSSLLLSSGLDGLVRLWNVMPSTSASSSVGATMLAEFHLGDDVLHMMYTRETSMLVTVTKAASSSKCATIQSRALLPLKELEAFRIEQQLGHAAVQVQKVWRGHQTRVLLAELLGEKYRRRRSSVGTTS